MRGKGEGATRRGETGGGVTRRSGEGRRRISKFAVSLLSPPRATSPYRPSLLPLIPPQLAAECCSHRYTKQSTQYPNSNHNRGRLPGSDLSRPSNRRKTYAHQDQPPDREHVY